MEDYLDALGDPSAQELEYEDVPLPWDEQDEYPRYDDEPIGFGHLGDHMGGHHAW